MQTQSETNLGDLMSTDCIIGIKAISWYSVYLYVYNSFCPMK